MHALCIFMQFFDYVYTVSYCMFTNYESSDWTPFLYWEMCVVRRGMLMVGSWLFSEKYSGESNNTAD